MTYTAKNAKEFREEGGSLASKITSELALIDAELDILAAGAGSGYGTLRLGAGAALPRVTNGAAEASPAETTTNKINYQYLLFDPDTQEYAQFSLSMPHDYNGGLVTAQVKGLSDSGSGDAIWGVQAVAIGDTEDIDAAFGSAKEVTDALTATALHVSAATTAITIAGTPAADKWTVFQVYRKAAAAGDTLTVDARFVELVVTYPKKTS